MPDSDSRRSNSLDDSRAALRMLMVELEALAPQTAPSPLGYAPRANEGQHWPSNDDSPHGTGRAA